MTLYLAIFLFFFFIGACVAIDTYRPRVLKEHDPNRPFTSEELKQIGIILPDPITYDCETFVTGKAYRDMQYFSRLGRPL